MSGLLRHSWPAGDDQTTRRSRVGRERCSRECRNRDRLTVERFRRRCFDETDGRRLRR